MRPEQATEIQVYGYVENVFDDRGNYVPRWMGWKKLVGVPYDIPVPGYGTNTVNFLRLWESRAPEEFDFEAFNRGGYEEAVREKNHSETISKVLYPNDKTDSGKELRLLQQYFFVACSLKDIIRRFRRTNEDWEDFPEKVAIQLNDTHPAIAVLELQRILHDEYGMPWDEAWSIVRRIFAYTNHTLLPEALEKWSVGLFQKVVPRHLQIFFEINKRFLEEVEAKWPGDTVKKEKLSLIEEGHTQMVRMAHLSVVGSHSVNGVAALHTELIKKDLFPDFDALYPGKNDKRLEDRIKVDLSRGLRGGGQSRRALRRAYQALARIQTPAPQLAAYSGPLPAPLAGPQPGDLPARLCLCGQGCPRLRHGQVHHQSHQRGGQAKGEEMYVVGEGEVDIIIDGFHFETVLPEGIFGELSLIDQETRSASAIARTDCNLQVIDKRRFLFLVQETPIFAIQVMKVMANRLRRIDLLIAKSDFERANQGAEG